MNRVYADPIEVWAVEQRPVRFVWRGRHYTVLRRLEHWITTRDWWRDSIETPTEDDPTRTFWRVEASDAAEVGVYELRHEPATGEWLLSRAWDVEPGLTAMGLDYRTAREIIRRPVRRP